MFGASKRSRSQAVMRNPPPDPPLEEEDTMRRMESSDHVRSIVQLPLPPGFRFDPTDEELVGYYLKKKVESGDLKIEVIALVDVYKYHPSVLPRMAKFGEDEWYFFTPREKKYPKGNRPNRAADGGFWKATGQDKAVVDRYGRKLGLKKSLVYYTGTSKNGLKSNWIMHEYRLTEGMAPTAARLSPESNQLDDLVLCRIYKKKASSSAQAAASQQEHDLDSMIAEFDDQINRASESATYENDVMDTSTSMERSSVAQLSSSMTTVMSNFCNSTSFGNPAANSSWNHNQMLHSMPSFPLQGQLSSQQPLDCMLMSQFHDSNHMDVASSSTHSPLHNLSTDDIHYEDGAFSGSFSYGPGSFGYGPGSFS